MIFAPSGSVKLNGQRAAALCVASGLVFAVGDGLVKSLLTSVPVLHMLWGRLVVFVVLLVLIAGRGRPRRLLATQAPISQLARAVALFVSTWAFLISVGTLPLGEVIALYSTAPLLVVCLAGPVLGERVSRQALFGACVGFVGVLLLVGLSPREFDLRVLLPLGGAAANAALQLLSRSVRHEPEEVTLFYTGALGLALATAALAIFGQPVPVPIKNWTAIGVAGVVVVIGNALLVMAYRRGRRATWHLLATWPLSGGFSSAQGCLASQSSRELPSEQV